MCPQCKQKASRWEIRFYGGICGECSIRRNLDANRPLGGEWTRSTKLDIQTHEKDVLQPLSKDGTINKDFVQVYGTQTLEKQYNLSKQEILKKVR